MHKVDYNRFYWPHSLADYKKMFSLSGTDLARSILEYAGGPSSFNAEMSASGRERVVSCDALYQTPAPDIVMSVNSGTQRLYDDLQAHPERYDLGDATDYEDRLTQFQNNAEKFIADYDEGCQAQRYIEATTDPFHFPDRHFKLALCPHYLMTGGLGDDVAAYVAVVEELCRVASELRVYPLVDSQGAISPMIGPLMQALQAQAYAVSVEEVPYVLQKQGNAMMRISQNPPSTSS